MWKKYNTAILQYPSSDEDIDDYLSGDMDVRNIYIKFINNCKISNINDIKILLDNDYTRDTIAFYIKWKKINILDKITESYNSNNELQYIVNCFILWLQENKIIK